MVRVGFLILGALMWGFVWGSNTTKDELTAQHLLEMQTRLEIEKMNIEMEVMLAKREAEKLCVSH